MPRDLEAMRAQRSVLQRCLPGCLLLAAVTFLLYLPVLRHEFVNYDDPQYVTENAMVKRGLTWEGVRWAFGGTHAGNWHPLTWLSHMLDCELYGLRAGGHHFTSLLLHTLNAVLLFWILSRMTRALGASLFVAALFAWHPLRLESVVWVAERKDVLSGFFWMLTLWAYVRYAEKSDWRRYALTLLWFALGLMSKPMLVTLPCVLLLLDFWPLRRLTREGALAWKTAMPAKDGKDKSGNRVEAPKINARPFRWLLLEKVPFLVLSGASSWLTFVVQEKAGAVEPLATTPLAMRITNALVSYVRYLGKALWPADLAVFYPLPAAWPVWQVTGAAVFLLAASVWAARVWRTRPYCAVGWFWYLGTLVPVIGLVQVGLQAMADRYTYVPLIGIFILVAWYGRDFCRQGHYPLRRARSLGALAALTLLGCLGATHWQLKHWRDSERLLKHAIQVTASNHLAVNLATTLLAQGRYKEAEHFFQAGFRSHPGSAEGHSNYGNLLAHQGRLPEAETHYRKAIALKPDYADAHHNLGIALSMQQRRAEGEVHLREAVRLDPRNPRMRFSLSVALTHLGRREEAAAHCAKAVELDPQDSEARALLKTLKAGVD